MSPMSPELVRKIQAASAGISSTSLVALKKQYMEHSVTHCSANTIPGRRSRLRRFIQFMVQAGITDVTEVNNSVIAIYCSQLTGKESSINANIRVIRGFFSWIAEYKEFPITVDPQRIKHIEEPKPTPKYIEFSIIESVIDNQSIAYVDRLLTAMASMLGLRAFEIANVRMCDIDKDQLHLIGKGKVEASVTIPAKVQRMVEVYRMLAPYRLDDDDYLFQSLWRGEYRKMSPKTIWSRLVVVFERVAQRKVTTHWLRHSYAVHLLLQGCDLVTIQKSLRHADLTTTQIYLNITDKVVSSQIHKYLG